METITNPQEQIAADHAKLSKAETLVAELLQERGDYEGKVNRLQIDSKQIQDMVHTSTHQMGNRNAIKSESRSVQNTE